MSDNHYYRRKEESRWEVADLAFRFILYALSFIVLIWLIGLASCTAPHQLQGEPITPPQLIPDVPAPACEGCRVLIDRSTGETIIIDPNNLP